MQAQWTALHGSEPDDLAARLDELRRQTDSLERQQALHKEWQQALDQRTGLARRLGELDQRMVEQEQSIARPETTRQPIRRGGEGGEQALEVTRELLQRQRLARSASVEQLRAGLVDGEACPVCGSQEHPYHHSEQLLAALVNTTTRSRSAPSSPSSGCDRPWSVCARTIPASGKDSARVARSSRN